MGRLTQLIIFLLFGFIILVSVSYAQTSTNCSDVKRERNTACGELNTKCLLGCASGSSDSRNACLQSCGKASESCYKQNSAEYDVCLKTFAPKSSEQPRTTTQQLQSQQSDKTSSEKDGTPFNIFGINPYQTWTNLTKLVSTYADLMLNEQELVDIGSLMSGKQTLQEKENQSPLKNNFQQKTATRGYAENYFPGYEKLLERSPELTEEIVKQAQEDWKRMTEPKQNVSPYRADVVDGQAQIKLPGSREWVDLKVGDRIPNGSVIFTGTDTTTLLSIRDKGVVRVKSFTQLTVDEKGLSEAAESGKTTTTMDLRTGEVEVNIEGNVFTGSLQVQTPSSTTSVRGTHFWVSYDKERKNTIAGVYKGTIAIKANGSDDSKLLSPNGEKPGVMLISQKLSFVKLFVIGLILSLITGFSIVLFKKRGKKTSRSR